MIYLVWTLAIEKKWIGCGIKGNKSYRIYIFSTNTYKNDNVWQVSHCDLWTKQGSKYLLSLIIMKILFLHITYWFYDFMAILLASWIPVYSFYCPFSFPFQYLLSWVITCSGTFKMLMNFLEIVIRNCYVITHDYVVIIVYGLLKYSFLH